MRRSLRPEKTKKRICEAMKSLLREKSFDKISISELVIRAGVSRSSFYNYFEEKEDIIMRIIDELADAISTMDIYVSMEREGGSDTGRIRKEVLDYSKEHTEDIKLLFHSGFAFDYMSAVRQRIYDVRSSYAYEYEDEDGNMAVLSEGPVYELKVMGDVNNSISALELYYEKYSDVPSDEYERLADEAVKLSMTGRLMKK